MKLRPQHIDILGKIFLFALLGFYYTFAGIGHEYRFSSDKFGAGVSSVGVARCQ